MPVCALTTISVTTIVWGVEGVNVCVHMYMSVLVYICEEYIHTKDHKMKNISVTKLTGNKITMLSKHTN